MQPGDVPVTFADTSALEHDSGFKPSTSLRDGLRAFAERYAGYYGGDMLCVTNGEVTTTHDSNGVITP